MMVTLTLFGSTTELYVNPLVASSVSDAPDGGSYVALGDGRAARVAESADDVQAALTAGLGANPPPSGSVVVSNIHNPIFDFSGGPATATVNGPWVWTSVYDPSTTIQVVTLSGKVRLEPNATGAIPLRFSLPLTPLPLFPYPEALCGDWTPDDAIAAISGWQPQPSAVLQAVPGGFEAQTVGWSADGKPQEIAVSLSYRAQ